jgi:DNA invertase Pin-like site-specific DNA recombinase
LGDSLRRQVELAERYAAAHNLELDTSSYQDHGISAFKGKNLQGSLGAFLKALDDGVIPTPSTLLVEALDRITRTEIDTALDLFLSIIRRDVTIVVLQGEQVFSKETIKRDRGISLIIAISMLVQGHEDSAKRGARIKAVYASKKVRGEISCNTYPGWLYKIDKKTFGVDKVKAATINRIFDMALDGFGTRIIARILHKEGKVSLKRAKSWNQSLISQVLNNTAVYGEKDGRLDYYPPIMSKEKFLMATASRRGRKWKTTRSPSIPNIFSGLAFCAICGSRVRYIPNLESPRLRCKRSVDLQDCRGKTYPYNACEEAFIYTMTRQAGLNISGEYLIQSQNAGAALQGEIATLKDKQKNLLKLATLAAGVEAVADELNLVQRDIVKLEEQLATADKVPLSRKELAVHKDVFDTYFAAKAAKSPDLIDIKRKVRVAMARLFKKIEFGVGKQGWEPVMLITLIDGTRAIVNVKKFLSPVSLIYQRKIKV